MIIKRTHYFALLLFCLSATSQGVAQVERRYKEVIADYAQVVGRKDVSLVKVDKAFQFDHKIIDALSQEKRSSRYYINAQTLLAFAYTHRAVTLAEGTEFNLFKQVADTARQLIDFAFHHVDKKEIRKNQAFYDVLLTQTGKNDRKITVGQVKKYLQNADTLLLHLQEQRAQLHHLSNNSLSAYHQLISEYQQFLQLCTSKVDISLLNEQAWKQFKNSVLPLYDSALSCYKQMQQFAAMNADIQNLPKLIKTIPQDYPFQMDSLEGLYVDTWQWVDISAWCGDLDKHRLSYLTSYNFLLDEQQSLLISKIGEIEDDTLLLSAPFQLNADTIALLDGFEKESLPLALFQYQEAYINLLSSMIEEDSYFNYESNRESVMHYYFGLKSEVAEVRNSIDRVWSSLTPTFLSRHQSFIQKHYGSEKGLRDYLTKQTKSLHAKLFYCNIRIKDQLIYKYLEKSYFPKYVPYEDYTIALFEQSPGLVVENGAYVTTQVIQQTDGVQYISGFRRGANKNPFVAKVVNQQVQWLQMLDMPVENAVAEMNGYGIVMNPVNKGCLLIVRAFHRNIHHDSSAVNILYELDDEGKQRHQVILSQKLYPLYSVKNEQDTSYVIAFKSKAGDKSTFPETLVANVNTTGQPTWSVEYPVDGRYTRLLKYNDDYLLVSNVVNLRDSNGNLLLVKNQKGSMASNVLVALLSKSGTTKHQKFFRSTVSHFATNAFVQENGDILVLGFKGGYNLNALADRPLLNVLLDAKLNVLVSNLEKEM